MPSYKVHYFDARGRAEIIRLLLSYAGQKFEDIRLNREQWQEFKPKTPFGQMPVLEIDGKLYGQTTAIGNYLAKEYGLYGKTSLDQLAIDQVENIVADFRQSAYKAFLEKDEAKKAELMQKFKTEDVPRFVGLFEKLLKENGTDYFVGSGVTLADLVVFDFIWGLNKNHPNVLDNFPLVQAHLEKIGSIPQIKTWLETRPVTNF